jgi:UDP-N-acetyl-D-glucosamine dehydrogenase
LQNAGAEVAYHDPHVPQIREEGVELSSAAYEPQRYDCVVIVTDHSALDYDRLVDEAPLIVDLRNATGAKGSAAEHVFKL